MKIKILADSTCDLSAELIEQHDIGIIPLCIVKDEILYRDSVEITTQDIQEHFESGRGVCTTAALNSADYAEAFREHLQGYDALIHINISSGFSSCYQNALLAAGEFDNVYVVDSKNLSSGSGQLVLLAAELAAAGLEPAAICATLNETSPKVESSFVIDTLTYLHKGGRCSSVAALGSNLLKIKPCIEVIDGSMKVGKKYRGPHERCILQYVKDRLTDRTDLDLKRIFITHSGCAPELVEAVREAVCELQPFEEVLETRAGCTIFNHCGPNTLGILFIRK